MWITGQIKTEVSIHIAQMRRIHLREDRMEILYGILSNLLIDEKI